VSKHLQDQGKGVTVAGSPGRGRNTTEGDLAPGTQIPGGELPCRSARGLRRVRSTRAERQRDVYGARLLMQQMQGPEIQRSARQVDAQRRRCTPARHDPALSTRSARQ